MNWERGLKLFDIKLIDTVDFTELLIRFAVDLIVSFIIVQYIYSKNSNRKDFYFSFMSVGAVVFLLCFLLNSVKLELGFALGLFAVFGIIRYRTDAIPIKEMTYLFVIIGVAIVNALSNKKVSYAELLFANAAIIFGLWILEKRLMLKQEKSIQITYEVIENIKKQSEEELLRDLKERTGIPVKRYEITRINFLRDVADITIYFDANNRKI